MNDQFKDLSAGDMEGLLCEPRHVGERYLGMRVESEAMKHGTELHKIAEAVNLMRKDGKDPGEDEIKALVAAADIPLHLKACKGGAEEVMLKWAERTYGSRPIDAERFRVVEIAGRRWQIKPDCVRMSADEDGNARLIVDDYKKGYVPQEDVARRTPRFMLYALAVARAYGYDTVTTYLWNLSQGFSIKIEWTADELARIERHLAPEAQKIIALHDRLMATPEAEWPTLLASLEPRLNDWCPSCPIGLKGDCTKLNALLRIGLLDFGSKPTADEILGRMIHLGLVDTGEGRLAVYEAVKSAARVVNKVADDMEGAIKGEALLLGRVEARQKKNGEEFTAHVLQTGDREAVVHTIHYPISPFKDKQPLLRAVFELGDREEVVERKKTYAVRTLEVADGLTVVHKINEDKEVDAAKEVGVRLNVKENENVKEVTVSLGLPEGQRQLLMVRRAV